MSMSTPAEIAELAASAGQNKSNLSAKKIIPLAILAGAYIGLAAIASTTAGAGWSEEWATSGFHKVLSAAPFTVGLILVILAGAELFTGNNMYLTLAAMDRRCSWGQVLKNWLIVYIMNFVGALIPLGIVYFGGFLLQNGVLTAFGAKAVATATAKVSMTWCEVFVRGIACNWLVCLAVWMSLGAKDMAGKVLAIFPPIFTFVLCGFEHCIANMYFIPAGIVAAQGSVPGLNWGSFFTANLIPATLGNIIGGAVFVAGFYWLSYLRKDKNNASASKEQGIPQ